MEGTLTPDKSNMYAFRLCPLEIGLGVVTRTLDFNDPCRSLGFTTIIMLSTKVQCATLCPRISTFIHLQLAKRKHAPNFQLPTFDNVSRACSKQTRCVQGTPHVLLVPLSLPTSIPTPAGWRTELKRTHTPPILHSAPTSLPSTP